ncbi:MAG: translocation/assembly module TamB domain-containing protein [Akkermansiaceae bacterium]|nr:translocation/assembly module TamB domain-containing protein [Akkermansiaceae bacterium]
MLPPEDKTKESPVPHRRWRRRVFYPFVLIAGLLTWGNGPGFRWGFEQVISQQLETQDLSGNFILEGSALSGISIRDISLNGTSTIQRFESDLIKVEWSLGSLIDLELESIALNRIHIVIDPEAPKTEIFSSDRTQGRASDSKTSLREVLSLIKDIIQPTKISMNNLKVEIDDITQFSLGSLTHTSGEDYYLISDLQSRDHLNQNIYNPESILTWNGDGIFIDQITLNSQLSIRDISFKPEESASMIISVAGSEVLAESDLESSHRISLESPSLSIPSLIGLVKSDLESSGEITKLEINTATGLIAFEACDLRYEDQKISHTSIEASTADLLSPFEKPVEIYITIDDKIKAEGTVVLDRQILDSSAELDLTVDWPKFPTINAEVHYDSREAHVFASTLDHLRASAQFQVDPQTYQAKIYSEINDAAILNENLEGPLNFTSTAKGNFKIAEHSGSTDLFALGFHPPNFPQVVTNGKVTWNWPNKIAVEHLKLMTSERVAETKLNWSNDTLEVDYIKVFEKEDELLTIKAKFPAPLPTRSLDDILESKKEISLKIKSKPLTLELLSSFFPVPAELSGIFHAENFDLSGTFTDPLLNGRISLKDFKSTTTPKIPPAEMVVDLRTDAQKLMVGVEAKDLAGQLLKLDGTFPFLPRKWLTLKMIPLDSPLTLTVKNDQLDLRRIQPLTPSIPDIKGTLNLDLRLSGSLMEPRLDGNINANNLNTSLQPNLPDLGLNLELKTTNQELTLNGSAKNENSNFMTIFGNLPLQPKTWLGRPESEPEKEFLLEIKDAEVDLSQIQPFVPIVKDVQGSLELNVKAIGTISNPQFSGDADLSVKKMRLDDSPGSEFRDSRIILKLANDIISFDETSIIASGGKATIGGTVNLASRDTDFDPVFDLSVEGKDILLYRTKDLNFRGHPTLTIAGPYSKAKIAGTVKIADSLIYKDVEILPFGVPRTTEIPKPNLPSFSQSPRMEDKIISTPSGIMDWNVEIDITTKDPVLIRGNLIDGQIIGQNLKLRGTIGSPTTSGILITENLVADLPFSKLEVQSGSITLRPDSPDNPYLDLKGSSKVSSYLVQVYVSGTVQNPKLVLTSDPPLPESEIMVLLATGSVSAQLANQEVASQKALQYLFETLRRRNGEKDKSVLQRFLKNSGQIKLSLGETNQYSGQNFSSATLNLDDRWDFTTQIDEQGQTRAFLVFSVRFK